MYDPADVGDLHPSPHVMIPAQIPYVLDDDFQPVEEINSWLRSLPRRGSYSPRTWSGYADDVLAWCKFIASRELGVFDPVDTLESALAEYRELRLYGGPGAEFNVLGATAWNRAVAALENFYSWALEAGRVDAKPFRYRQVRLPQGVLANGFAKKNLAKARPGSILATLKYLAPDYADLFVDVGLGGNLPSGDPDLTFRGRLAVRNRAAGSLVRASGLRRQEFSNLLVWEVPELLDAFSDYRALFVSPTIAKGARARATWISADALKAVHTYKDVERDTAVSNSRWMPERPLIVNEPDSQGAVIAGRRVAWSKLTISQRRRLVTPEGGSGLLFVAGSGAPVAENNWRYTFDTAAERCRTFVSDFPDVSPHMLRHTFAMETLRTLTRKALSRAELLARVSGEDPLLIAILRRNDPLLILRDFLGHTYLKTTEAYLVAQDPASIFTEVEVALLAEDDELDRALVS